MRIGSSKSCNGKAYYVDPSWELDQYKWVEFYYCPACGGNRTQKVVYLNDNWSTGEAADWTLTKWLRYETLGLDQLRVDEKYDADQDGLDEGDPFRTERATYDAPSGIGYIMKETLYTYSTPYTASNPSKEDIWFHYDRMMVVNALSNSDGAFMVGQRFHGDAFGQFEGSAAKTTRRITAKEYDQDIALYYFNARWYFPEVGDFLSRSVWFPASEGAYLFCSNDTVNRRDVAGTLDVAYPYRAADKDAVRQLRECACRGLYEWDRRTVTGAISNAVITVVNVCGTILIDWLPYVDVFSGEECGPMKGCGKSADETGAIIRGCGLPDGCSIIGDRIDYVFFSGHERLYIECPPERWFFDPWHVSDAWNKGGLCDGVMPNPYLPKPAAPYDHGGGTCGRFGHVTCE